MQNANPNLSGRSPPPSQHQPAGLPHLLRHVPDSLAAAGKRTLHLLDIAFPDAAGPEPRHEGGRGGRAQENRARLKESLGRSFGAKGAGHAGIRTHLADHRTWKSRSFSRNGASWSKMCSGLFTKRKKAAASCFTADRPAEGQSPSLPGDHLGGVLPAPNGYVVHTAYSHRIEVMGGPRT